MAILVLQIPWKVLLFFLALVAPEMVPTPAPVLQVPVFRQVYNLSCEAASLQMALAYEGVHLTQAHLVSLMQPDDMRPEMNGDEVVRWGDPYLNFVGNPSGHEYDHTGYGAYYPVVARVAREAGGRVLWSGTGFGWSNLERAIQGGHPVVMWISYDGRSYGPDGRLVYYRAWDGRPIPYAPGFEHAVTVAGIGGSAVLLNNPYTGRQAWLGKAAFLDATTEFGNMAVVIG